MTIPSHLSHSAPLTCEGTPSTNLRIIIVVSTLTFIILTCYCHSSSQWGGDPMKCGQVDRTVKEVWEGRGPTEWICDLSWGHHIHQPSYGSNTHTMVVTKWCLLSCLNNIEIATMLVLCLACSARLCWAYVPVQPMPKPTLNIVCSVTDSICLSQ